MTTAMASVLAARLAPPSAWASAWAAPIAIALALGGIVGARLLAVRAGLDPLLVGAAFGGALGALAIAFVAPRKRRLRLPTRAIVKPTLVGALAGLALVAVAVVGPTIGGATVVPGLGRPAAPFAPWALITLLVAAAEEGVLRGALFDRLERVGGLATAVVLTTLAFALMHVPLYGWHVVPLDLAVGLVLAGLRIGTRGLAAPVAAHAVADLATWWL
jgi:membrane protease YdiL (CAAX protease family)